VAPNPEAIAWYLRRSEDLLDDLREQARTIRSLLDAIESITIHGDEAARAVRKAEYSFLTGLGSVGSPSVRGGDLLIPRLFKKKKKKKKWVGPVKPNPPPWDVPLDQTKAPLHTVGDITSV
jgi:hypothetical protein